MNETPITAVIPVYNGERFIGECIESVVSQTRPPLEVIVVNDGSTDATEEIVRRKFPDVRYHRQPNRGVAAARNTGIELAQSDWIAFLDADDLWYPEKLAVQCAEIAAHPDVGLVYSDLDRIDGEGNVVEACALSQPSSHSATRRRTDPAFIAFGGLPFPYPSTVVVRKEALLRAGGFNAAFPGNYHEDLEAFARAFRITPVRFIARSLIGYRIGDSLPPRAPGRSANWLLLLNSLWQLWRDEPERQGLLVTEFARHYAHEAKGLLRAGEYVVARRSLRRALAYRPGMAKAWSRLALSYLPIIRDFYARRKRRLRRGG